MKYNNKVNLEIEDIIKITKEMGIKISNNGKNHLIGDKQLADDVLEEIVNEIRNNKKEVSIMYIYTITVFEKFHDKYGHPSNSRCIGYYDNFEEADKAVKNNFGDMCELLYNYVVIEKVEAGLYPACTDRWFYKINVKDSNYKNIKYSPIEEPECVKNIVNFAIG